MSYKNKNIVRQFPYFTHFATVPFIKQEERNFISKTQQLIVEKLNKHGIDDVLKEHEYKLCHLSLFMLTLGREQVRCQLAKIVNSYEQDIRALLNNRKVKIGRVKHFNRFNKVQKSKEVIVIILQVIEDQTAFMIYKLSDKFIRKLLQEQIIVDNELKPMHVIYDLEHNLYRPQNLHISLFRAHNLMQTQAFLKAQQQINQCLGQQQFQISLFDISTMKQYDKDQYYKALMRIPIQFSSKQQIK